MEKDKITLPSGETFSKWRFIDIDRIEYSEEHKDKFEKKHTILNLFRNAFLNNLMTTQSRKTTVYSHTQFMRQIYSETRF